MNITFKNILLLGALGFLLTPMTQGAIQLHQQDELIRGEQTARLELERQYLTGIEPATCSICMEEHPKFSMVKTICHHWFHATCINSWLTSNNSCPYCRHQPVTSPTIENYHKLVQAITYEQLPTIQALIRYGADVNFTIHRRGATLLHMAVWHDFFQAIQEFIRAGANINAIDTDGNAPLHIAASKNNTEAILFLLRMGAQKELQNSDGNTAYDIARNGMHHESADLLREEGAQTEGSCVPQ